MEGTIIARGERPSKASPHKKILLITAIVVAVVMLIGIVAGISQAAKTLKEHTHSSWCYSYYYRDDFYTDSRNDNLQAHKMDCAYTGNAFFLGVKNYFEGGILFPFLLALAGAGVALFLRARAKGFVVSVSEQAVIVAHEGGKMVEIPLCSVFSVNKINERDLSIVTSENNYVLRDMDSRDEVYEAIFQRIPELKVKNPINNEQILAKGYPPAIKPVLLVLLILIALASVIAAIAAEMFAVVFIGIIPFAIVLVLYLLAKTPYFVVTNKRVFFVTDFGRKLSLPISKITVIVTHRWFNQLHVAAPTGRIHLFWMRNAAELYDVINAQINEIQ